MSSSTYKKAIQGRSHKERSQPSDRKKLGFLEKHKDYVLRAKDFHKKEKAIQILREKAEFRNPDEFYFGMQNARTAEGIHLASSSDTYTQEQILLMKTQDKKYIEMKAQTERKKVEKLKASLHFLGEEPVNKHTVFVEDEKERQCFNPVEYFDTSPEFLERSFHRPTKAQLEKNSASVRRVHSKKRPGAYKELVQREQRQTAMENAALRMEIEKAAMGKGRKRRVFKASQNGGRPLYKWKKERKR